MLNLKLNLEERINGLVQELQRVITNYYATKYPSQYQYSRPVITVDWGCKYARIVKKTGDRKSVHSFIDLSNGDIIKAKSWEASAKKTCGNVCDDNYGIVHNTFTRIVCVI